MAKLIYSAITSLDGYVADRDGRFDWSIPDDEVHAAVNDVMRPIGTHLYGRRIYEVMVAWETLDTTDEPAVIKDFADIWRRADKVVYSTTLQAVSSRRTRIERHFDGGEVAQLKIRADSDLLIGGPTLAGHALELELVDELHLFVSPVLAGGGIRALPEDLGASLSQISERGFGNGVVHAHFAVTG